MSNIRSFSNLLCAKCGEVTLHNSAGCVHCFTAAAPYPCISRDIGALTYSGQTALMSARRLRRTGNLSRSRAMPIDVTRPRGIRGERPRTIARDVQIIRRLAAGVLSRVVIAREFEVSPQAVGDAIRRTYARLAVPLPKRYDDHSALIETARQRGVIA